MMHISAFAKLCGTTVKTLRHYDRIGILLPDYVSPRNGYRYYRRSTADRYFQIRAMQEAGLTLREIGESLSDRQGVIDLLAERAKALQMQAAHCKALQEACEDALLQQKRYTVTVQEELVQISCAETGETIQVNAEEAYRAVVLRLVENGLSEERLLSLNFDDVREHLTGCDVCSTGAVYNADCDPQYMEAAIRTEMAKETEVLLLYFSCSPDVPLDVLVGAIEELLLSFSEKAAVLFSADAECGNEGVFLEWVCLRKLS